MKHRFVLVLFAGSFLLLCSCREPAPQNKGPFSVDIGESQIPYITIDTKGTAILYEPKIAATLKVFEKKALVQEQKIGIEFRGKTSYRLSEKKNFNIETVDDAGNDTEVSFFGMPAEEDWRLIGHVVNLKDKYIFDKTLMYNYVGYELSRTIGKYASRTQFVELELNGEYLGVYVLMERLKRDGNRINIKSLSAGSANITGGYIITIDKASLGDAAIGKPLSYFDNNWDDDARYTAQNSFRSKYDIFKNLITFPPYGAPYHPQKYLETYFLYEYPGVDAITSAQKDYIANYVHLFETALIADNFSAATRTYTNLIDISSFVDYFIINELCRNVDAYRLSTYLQKDRDGKLAMGPVWDMDIAFDNGDRVPIDNWVINYNTYVSSDAWMMPFWWPRLLEDPIFKAAIKQRWAALRTNQYSNGNLIELVTSTAGYLKSNGAVQRNYTKWDQGIGVNYDAAIESLKNFLIQRATWMDAAVARF